MHAAAQSSLLALHARLGLHPQDLPAGAPFTEARELVSVGDDCFERPALLAPAAATAWCALQSAAASDGHTLLLVSAFRSYEKQALLFERKLRAGLSIDAARRLVAIPGYSQHHTGCAIDVAAEGFTELVETFEDTPEFRWLAQRAGEFGFTMPYGRDNAHGMAYEPWHWFHESPVAR